MRYHDRAPFVPISRRPPLHWPNGARLAVWVVPNIEHFEEESLAGATIAVAWMRSNRSFDGPFLAASLNEQAVRSRDARRFVVGRDDNHRDPANLVVGQLRAAELLARHHRHHQVEDDQRRIRAGIEAFERGEIIRVLAFGTPTMADAARELGMSRATLYRKIAQYGIEVDRD